MPTIGVDSARNTRCRRISDTSPTVSDAMEFNDQDDPRFYDRELSWIAFNGRVLQEAESGSVPLGDRLLFLAIFSANLDEFFRVRVAALRSLLVIKKKKRKKLLQLRPKRLLRRISDRVTRQQEKFGRVFREQLIPALGERGVDLLDEGSLDPEQAQLAKAYFESEVRPHLTVSALGNGPVGPFVEDHTCYLVVETVAVDEEASRLALVWIPSPPLPRFFEIPDRSGRTSVMFLDDVIRCNLGSLFPDREVRGAWAIKVSRDADLYLEDELGTDLKEIIRKSLLKRQSGMPVRFLYDLAAPVSVVARIKEALDLVDEDLIEGGRYHNLHDLAGFPLPDESDLRYRPMPPLAHPDLEGVESLLEVVARKDRLLRFPYQSYGYVIQFLREAAEDPQVEEIWISLYRVAADSAVAEVLIQAASQGKRVTVFVEFQARFDEQANLEWADRMEAAGVRTLHSRPGIKVHAKIALVRRREDGKLRGYAYLATGNFNEKTARIYADHGVFTADPRLTDEVYQVFRILAGEEIEPHFEHLLVAPFTLRSRFEELILAEQDAAASGSPAGITVKVNSFQDRPMIERIYAAAQAGVQIRMVVRGICCARPGVAELSEGLQIRSIVDRFLEHSRIYHFHAGGSDMLYLASADWMTRNLNRRVEVAFPIYDDDIRRELLEELQVQLADDTKSRIIDADHSNEFVAQGDGTPVRAQYLVYDRLEQLLEEASK